ncbi:MAG TPA: HdeA/HdeB family chaperone [Xanthobacteraceae bacterium]|jgi:hypothetical protein
MTRFYLVLISAILETTVATQAQETIDVGKVTCEQFIMGQVADSRSVSIWLSGFYNGTRNNTILDVNALQKNSQGLMDYCIGHGNEILMSAAKSLFGTKQ